MKYRKTRTGKRTDSLFLALNWYLTDEHDREHSEKYIAEAEGQPTYSQDELEASLAMRYIGRFNTSRLRKKRADDLYWLERSKHIDWSKFET